jgi:hypothetical protein
LLLARANASSAAATGPREESRTSVKADMSVRVYHAPTAVAAKMI